MNFVDFAAQTFKNKILNTALINKLRSMNGIIASLTILCASVFVMSVAVLGLNAAKCIETLTAAEELFFKRVAGGSLVGVAVCFVLEFGLNWYKASESK